MTKKQLFLVSALLVLCILPALALAEESSGPKLSLRLRGGYNYLKAGDVNLGTQGIFDDAASYYNPGNGWTATGGFKALHYGVDFGFDFIIEFNRHWVWASAFRI